MHDRCELRRGLFANANRWYHLIAFDVAVCGLRVVKVAVQSPRSAAAARSAQPPHDRAPSAAARSEQAQSTSADWRLSVAAAVAAAVVEQGGLDAHVRQATAVPRKPQRRALGPVQTSPRKPPPLPQCSPSLSHQSTVPVVPGV
jgi:hypothetical protein